MGLCLPLEWGYGLLADHSFHLHVAAQRDGRDDILGLTPPESGDLGPEPYRKARHLDVHGFRRPEVAQLMDQDQDAQYDYRRKNGDQHSLKPSGTGKRASTLTET